MSLIYGLIIIIIFIIIIIIYVSLAKEGDMHAAVTLIVGRGLYAHEKNELRPATVHRRISTLPMDRVEVASVYIG